MRHLILFELSCTTLHRMFERDKLQQKFMIIELRVLEITEVLCLSDANEFEYQRGPAVKSEVQEPRSSIDEKRVGKFGSEMNWFRWKGR